MRRETWTTSSPFSRVVWFCCTWSIRTDQIGFSDIRDWISHWIHQISVNNPLITLGLLSCGKFGNTETKPTTPNSNPIPCQSLDAHWYAINSIRSYSNHPRIQNKPTATSNDATAVINICRSSQSSLHSRTIGDGFRGTGCLPRFLNFIYNLLCILDLVFTLYNSRLHWSNCILYSSL